MDTYMINQLVLQLLDETDNALLVNPSNQSILKLNQALKEYKEENKIHYE